MENSSPRDILYKSQLASIQRKYRRSIDPAAAGRDVVSPAHRRSGAGTETGPAGVDVQVFECHEIGLPATRPINSGITGPLKAWPFRRNRYQSTRPSRTHSIMTPDAMPHPVLPRS